VDLDVLSSSRKLRVSQRLMKKNKEGRDLQLRVFKQGSTHCLGDLPSDFYTIVSISTEDQEMR
jgi:hypothetical protein